jgi:hypothetical protein
MNQPRTSSLAERANLLAKHACEKKIRRFHM